MKTESKKKEKMKKTKGLILLGLLVATAVVALFLGVYMPARESYTTQSGIDNALVIYSNDYDDELPRSGGRNSTWTPPDRY